MRALVVLVDLFSILAIALFAIFVISSNVTKQGDQKAEYLVAEMRIYCSTSSFVGCSEIDFLELMHVEPVLVSRDSTAKNIEHDGRILEVRRADNSVLVTAVGVPSTHAIAFNIVQCDHRLLGKEITALIRQLYPNPNGKEFEFAIGNVPSLIVPGNVPSR